MALASSKWGALLLDDGHCGSQGGHRRLCRAFLLLLFSEEADFGVLCLLWRLTTRALRTSSTAARSRPSWAGALLASSTLLLVRRDGSTDFLQRALLSPAAPYRVEP